MLNQSLDILSKARSWLKQNHKVLLHTVIDTYGSSPRPINSIMVMRDDGQIVGSVSGGCIEDDLIENMNKNGIPNRPVIIEYGGDSLKRFGLPCGGTLRLLQESLNNTEQLDELLAQISARKTIARKVNIGTGKTTLRKAVENESLHCDAHHLTSIFGPQFRLLIIGAGQVSSLLAEIILSMDFAVTVCDPRIEYHQQWQLADAELVTTMPDDAVIDMKVDRSTAIVTLTHDPKLDDMALLEGLKSSAFYIAALGSKLSNQKRRERLALFDLSDEQIAKLRGPAGLPIGSKTPAEIAISIAAELVAVKNYQFSVT